jgi:hypothetical protein
MSIHKKVKEAETRFALNLFRDGLERGGCLICRALGRIEEQSVFSFLYEGMSEPHALRRFVEGGGFCPRHFWWVMHMGLNRWGVGIVEVATLSREIVRAAMSGLSKDKRARDQPTRSWFVHLRKQRSESRCMFCCELREREQALVELLEGLAGRSEFASALSETGICFPHARMSLNTWKQPGKAEMLLEFVRFRSNVFLGQLNEFLRKYDYRHKDEPFGPEIDVVQRAVEFLAGRDRSRRERENLKCGPWESSQCKVSPKTGRRARSANDSYRIEGE